MNVITVVIPSYKNPDRVGRAIQSALDQPDIDVNVVVVIDDQCERTRAIAEAFGTRVNVIFNERNRGAPFSRNAGLAQAETPHVMFLDSDDYLEGRLLASICERMLESRAQLGFGPAISHQDETGARHYYPPPPDTREQLFSDWMIGPFCVPSCSVVWETSFVCKIGGWDEELRRNQDGELVMRALLKGANTCFVAEGAGVYVKHGGEHRITRQRKYGSNVRAVEKLLALQGPAIPPATVRRSSAIRLYEIARLAFQHHDNALGRRTLAMSRELGFSGHRGPLASRALNGIVGLENTQRLRQLLKARARRRVE